MVQRSLCRVSTFDNLNFFISSCHTNNPSLTDFFKDSTTWTLSSKASTTTPANSGTYLTLFLLSDLLAFKLGIQKFMVQWAYSDSFCSVSLQSYSLLGDRGGRWSQQGRALLSQYHPSEIQIQIWEIEMCYGCFSQQSNFECFSWKSVRLLLSNCTILGMVEVQ